MSLEKLLSEGKIEAIKQDKLLIERALSRADKDSKNAKIQLENDGFDWALAIAYNSMLQCGRALMFYKGYRPKGEYKHLAVIEFVHEEFGREFSTAMIRLFDNFRKKRNRVVYEETDIVSEEEAKAAIEFAREFIKKTRSLLNI